MNRNPSALAGIICLAALSACKGGTLPALPEASSLQSARASAPLFVAQPLPRPFKPHAIMSDGQVVGTSAGAAAVYENGTLIILGRYNGNPTYATSINSQGTAVGYATLRSKPWDRPLEFTSGQIIKLPFVPNCRLSSTPTAIDDAGNVYGSCWQLGEDDTPSVARFTPNGAMLGTDGDDRGYITSISADGVFALSFCVLSMQCTAWRGNTENTFILNFPRRWSTAAWINNNHVITGTSAEDYDFRGPLTAFIYPPGGPVQYLPFLSGSMRSYPVGINDSNQVVGYTGERRIFFYTSGSMYDITQSISPAGQYSALGVQWVGSGLSDTGEFLASQTVHNKLIYYLVRPAP